MEWMTSRVSWDNAHDMSCIRLTHSCMTSSVQWREWHRVSPETMLRQVTPAYVCCNIQCAMEWVRSSVTVFIGHEMSFIPVTHSFQPLIHERYLVSLCTSHMCHFASIYIRLFWQSIFIWGLGSSVEVLGFRYEWVMAHLWMRHDTHTTKSQHTYERFTALIVWMRALSIYQSLHPLSECADSV